MSLMIDRFFLSRLESLSADAPSLPNLPRAVKGETVSVVSVFLRSSRRPSSVLRDLRPRSPSDIRRNSLRKPAPPATDSPTLASRLVGQCFYSDAGASGGKTLISRLNLLSPPPAAPSRACPLWHLWSVSASADADAKTAPKHHRPRMTDIRPKAPADYDRHHTPGRSYRRHKFICHD